MANDVFLSYARTDIERARTIKKALEDLGLSVFFDTEGLDGGDVFPDILDREVKHAGAIVGVWSTHALTRPWVKIECDIGKTRGVLVPIQIEPIADLDRPAAFWNIQFADLSNFTGNTNHAGWRGFLRSLARTLDRDDLLGVDARAPSAPPVQTSAFGEIADSKTGRFKPALAKSNSLYDSTQSQGLPILIAVVIASAIWYATGFAIGRWLIQPQMESMIQAGKPSAQIGFQIMLIGSLSLFFRTFLACLLARFLTDRRRAAAWLTTLAVSVFMVGATIFHTYTLVTKFDAPLADILPQQALSALISIVVTIIAGLIVTLLPLRRSPPPPT